MGLQEFLFVPKLKLTGLSTGICHTFFVVAYVYFLVWDCSFLFDKSNATPPETSCNGFIFKSHHFFFTFFVQLYCFEDRGNRRVALRPELTPSLARLVIQKGYFKFLMQQSCCFCIWIAHIPFYVFLYPNLIVLDKTFRFIYLFSYDFVSRYGCRFDLHVFFGPEDRYPSHWNGLPLDTAGDMREWHRGRRREHYQWNMDIIGVPEVTVSASELAWQCPHLPWS